MKTPEIPSSDWVKRYARLAGRQACGEELTPADARWLQDAEELLLILGPEGMEAILAHAVETAGRLSQATESERPPLTELEPEAELYDVAALTPPAQARLYNMLIAKGEVTVGEAVENLPPEHEGLRTTVLIHVTGAQATLTVPPGLMVRNLTGGNSGARLGEGRKIEMALETLGTASVGFERDPDFGPMLTIRSEGKDA